MDLKMKSFGKRGLATLILASAALAASACSKAGPSSSVSVGLPNFTAAAAMAAQNSTQLSSCSATQKQFLSRVMINISASDISSPAVLIWQRGNDFVSPDPTQMTFPTPIATGSNRLVQVLAIVSCYSIDASSGSYSQQNDVFYYGDSVVTISGSNSSPSVDLSNFVAGNTNTSGAVAGRYLTDSTGAGPTGRIDIKYAPPSRPDHPMIVTNAEIHGGWFEVVAFENLPFSYWFEDGRQLLTSTPDVSDRTRVRVRIPAAYKQNNGTYTATDPLNYYFGFFGPGDSSSTYEMCFNSTTGGALSNFAADSAGSTSITWNANGTVDSTHAGVLAGGTGTSTGYCPAGDGALFAKTLGFNYSGLNDHGTLGFVAPFRIFDAGNSNFQLFSAAWNSSTSGVDMKWAFLPGTLGSDRVSGVEVFWRKLSAAINDGGGNRQYQVDGLSQCGLLVSKYGFQSGGRFAYSGDWTTIQSASISGMSAADFGSNLIEIVACPYSTTRGIYFQDALIYPSGGGGSGSNMSVATQLTVSDLSSVVGTATTNQKVEVGTCTPILIQATDANGKLGYPTSARQLSVTSDSTSYDQFYTDANCSSTALNPMTITGFWNRQVVYVKSSRTGAPVTGAITVADTTGSNVLSSGASIVGFAASGNAPTNLAVLTASNLMAYQCAPVSYQLQTASGLPANLLTGSATFTLPTTSGLTLYTDPGCSSQASTSVTFNSTPGTTTASYYMIYTGTQTTIAVGASGTSNGVSASSLNVSVTQPGAMARVGLNMNNQFMAMTCQAVQVAAEDSKGSLTPVTAATTVTLGATAGGFFTSQTGCTSAATATSGAVSSATIPTGSTYTTLYYRADLAQTVTLNASSTGLTSSSMTATVSAPDTTNLAQVLVMRAPGQTFQFSQPIMATTAPIAVSASSYYSRFYMYAGTSDLRMANGSGGTTAYNETRTVTITTPNVTFSDGTVSKAVAFSSGSSAAMDLLFGSVLNGTNTEIDVTLSPSSVYGMATTAKITVPVSLYAVVKMGNYGSTTQALNVCQPMLTTFEDQYGTIQATSGSADYNLELIDSTGSNYSSGAIGIGSSGYGCGAATYRYDGVVAAGVSSQLNYASYAVTESAGQISWESSAYFPGIRTVNVISSAVAASRTKVYGSTSPKAATCTPYLIESEDSNGVSVGAGTDLSIPVSLTGAIGGALYSDATCSTALGSMVTLPNVQKAVVIYYKSTGSGSDSIATGTASALSGNSLSFTVRP